MKGLAELIVRGRWQAVLVTAAAGALTYLLVPFTTVLSYLAAAAVALVTLHIGILPGLQVLVLASAATLLFYQLVGLHAVVVLNLLLVLLLWLPCWLLALVLRQTRSLPQALLASVLFGGCLLLAVYGYFGDPAPWWVGRLQEFETTLGEAGIKVQSLGDHELVGQIAALMTGVVVSSLITGVVGSLLLARWWQSLLVHPGAFREEFCSLRLGNLSGLLTVAIMVLARFMPDAAGDLAAQLAMVMLVPYLLAGLAVIHSLVKHAGRGKGWLVAVYVALAFLPQASLLLAGGGLLDTWLDFRRRFQRGGSGGN
ncbi:MAG TPA: hypothetical protein VM011_12420 [Gammaproteobacteria bacterium]|nr:hypothetical protein [Gammaproteobacteria bacterium]